MSIQGLGLPQKFEDALEIAIDILKKEGCLEIYIFGSLAENRIHNDSDIDIAVKGMPPKKYFKLIGKLELSLDMSIDLINLDEKNNRFVQMLQSKGGLIRVA